MSSRVCVPQCAYMQVNDLSVCDEPVCSVNDLPVCDEDEPVIGICKQLGLARTVSVQLARPYVRNFPATNTVKRIYVYI